MEFNKEGFQKFREDFNQAVKVMEEKHQIKIELGAIGYDPIGFFNAKLKVSKTDVDVDKNIWIQNSYLYGLDKDLFGKVFMHDGNQYKILGLKLSSKKFPVKVTNGKKISYFNAMTVKSFFNNLIEL